MGVSACHSLFPPISIPRSVLNFCIQLFSPPISVDHKIANPIASESYNTSWHVLRKKKNEKKRLYVVVECDATNFWLQI